MKDMYAYCIRDPDLMLCIVGIAGLIYPALYFSGLLLGLMHVNAADHVLHLVVGLVAAGVGFFVSDYPSRAATPA